VASRGLGNCALTRSHQKTRRKVRPPRRGVKVGRQVRRHQRHRRGTGWAKRGVGRKRAYCPLQGTGVRYTGPGGREEKKRANSRHGRASYRTSLLLRGMAACFEELKGKLKAEGSTLETGKEYLHDAGLGEKKGLLGVG